MSAEEQIRALQRELVSQHTGRMATMLAQPNAHREIKNKHRPTHFLNLSKKSDGNPVVGTAGNTYTIVGKIPIGFEFDRAVYDATDAVNYGLVSVDIEKYKANAGKSSAANDPGPLSLLDSMLRSEDAWGPSGFFDKQVGSADLDITITIYCWKTSTDPFHGIGLLGKDHTNYCPLTERLVPPKRGFKLLPQLGPSAGGLIQQIVGSVSQHARTVMGHLTRGNGYDQQPAPPR